MAILGVATPSFAADDTQVQASAFLPNLSENQRNIDELPEVMNVEDFDGVSSTSRYIGSDTTANYWVYETPSSDICLVAHIPSEEFSVAASSCSSILAFFKRGLAVGVTNGLNNESTSAFLLPADITLEKNPAIDELIGASVIEFGGSLLLSFPGNDNLPTSTMELHRNDAGAFIFTPFPAEIFL